MIRRPVTHLLPRVDAVTVGAQQAKVALVGGPVLEPVVPGLRSPGFLRSIDVVDVENTVVSLTAYNALSAKLFQQGKLSPPISGVLVDGVAVLVPVCRSAINTAKTMFAGFAAALARRLPLPPRGKVASAPAILPGAIFEAIKMGFKRLFAVAAGDSDSALFHRASISHLHGKQKYFDIACKRIEDAQRQGDLFIEGAVA